MKRDLKPVRDLLRKDQRCERLLRIFSESTVYNIPFNALTKEVTDIHRSRSVRFLSRSEGRFIEHIVDASLRDQANRSRLTEISMQCFKAQAMLQESLIPLQEYLLLRYGSAISFVRTKEERRQLVDMALRPLHKFIAQCATLKQLSDMVVADIDKAAWSLKLLVQAYELHSKPEASI